MQTEITQFEAVVAVYGVPNEHGDVLSETAALHIFDQLRQQETVKAPVPGYRVVDSRIEGDRKSGAVYATFKREG